ncbi:MAG: hypothetical protein U0441_25865 [Polyangiaceae bacterium]
MSPTASASTELSGPPASSRGKRRRSPVGPGLRSGSRRLFAVALVLAFVAHLPALPFDPLFLGRLLLHHAPPPAPPDPEPAEVLVPIDLDLESEPPRTTDAPSPNAPPPNAPESPPSTDAAPAPEAPAKGPDASSKSTPIAEKKADDIYDALDTPKHATATLKDPLSVAGGPGKFGPKDPFVQVLFNGNRLRSNAAGIALGGVLTALPEWKSFFQGTEIDPIEDAEHLLIAGPQFRKSGDVVVWMQYRVSEADMKAAVDTLVKRTKGGKWLEDAPVPAAIAMAHQHKRIFALIPGKKLLVILPLASKDQLAKIKGVRAFSNTSKAGIVISLATPKNAFADVADIVDVPATFKWLRLVVTPAAAGGADVALEIGDASADAAAKDAPALEKQLGQVRTLAKLATVIGADVLPPMTVQVDRDILRVNATVSQKGLQHILNLAKTYFAKRAEPEAKPTKNAKGDDEVAEKKENAPAPSTSATSSASATPSSTPHTPTTTPSTSSSANAR